MSSGVKVDGLKVIGFRGLGVSVRRFIRSSSFMCPEGLGFRV